MKNSISSLCILFLTIIVGCTFSISAKIINAEADWRKAAQYAESLGLASSLPQSEADNLFANNQMAELVDFYHNHPQFLDSKNDFIMRETARILTKYNTTLPVDNLCAGLAKKPDAESLYELAILSHYTSDNMNSSDAIEMLIKSYDKGCTRAVPVLCAYYATDPLAMNIVKKPLNSKKRLKLLEKLFDLSEKGDVDANLVLQQAFKFRSNMLDDLSSPLADRLFNDAKKESAQRLAQAGIPYFQFLYHQLSYNPKDTKNEESYSWLKKACDNGSPEAWREMGLLLSEKHLGNYAGIHKNLEESIRCFEKVVTLPYNEAVAADTYYDLGYAYENGIGVEADIKRAADYYRRSFSGGSHPLAAIRLGYMYESGLFGEPDYKMAFYYYFKGKAPVSLYKIAEFYDYGKGVEQSPETALRYYIRVTMSDYPSLPSELQSNVGWRMKELRKLYPDVTAY